MRTALIPVRLAFPEPPLTLTVAHLGRGRGQIPSSPLRSCRCQMPFASFSTGMSWSSGRRLRSGRGRCSCTASPCLRVSRSRRCTLSHCHPVTLASVPPPHGQRGPVTMWGKSTLQVRSERWLALVRRQRIEMLAATDEHNPRQPGGVGKRVHQHVERKGWTAGAPSSRSGWLRVRGLASRLGANPGRLGITPGRIRRYRRTYNASSRGCSACRDESDRGRHAKPLSALTHCALPLPDRREQPGSTC